MTQRLDGLDLDAGSGECRVDDDTDAPIQFAQILHLAERTHTGPSRSMVSETPRRRQFGVRHLFSDGAARRIGGNPEVPGYSSDCRTRRTEPCARWEARIPGDFEVDPCRDDRLFGHEALEDRPLILLNCDHESASSSRRVSSSGSSHRSRIPHRRTLSFFVEKTSIVSMTLMARSSTVAAPASSRRTPPAARNARAPMNAEHGEIAAS